MSLQYLRQLEHAAFPFRVSDPDTVDRIEALLQADLVEGGIGTSAADQQRIAIVRRITPLGRAQLALNRNSQWDELATGRKADPALEE